jgi:hypothetical protein
VRGWAGRVSFVGGSVGWWMFMAELAEMAGWLQHRLTDRSGLTAPIPTPRTHCLLASPSLPQLWPSAWAAWRC